MTPTTRRLMGNESRRFRSRGIGPLVRGRDLRVWQSEFRPTVADKHTLDEWVTLTVARLVEWGDGVRCERFVVLGGPPRG